VSFLIKTEGESMAAIKSQIMTMASGSIGGITFTRTGIYPLVVRARVKPVNRGTCYQDIVRTLFNQAAIAYKSLDSAQHGAWDAYADGTPYTNRLGDTVYYGGRHTYVAIRGFITYALPTVTADNFNMPRCQPGWLIKPTTALGPGTDTTQDITVTNASDSESIRFVLWWSNPQSRVKKFYKGPWNPLQVYRSTTLPPLGNVVVHLTGLCPNSRYFYRIRAWAYDPPNLISQCDICVFETPAPL